MTTRVYSTKPTAVRMRKYLEEHPEVKERIRQNNIKKRSDPEYKQKDREISRKCMKKRYENDAEFREKKRKDALARYYKMKAEKEQQ